MEHTDYCVKYKCIAFVRAFGQTVPSTDMSLDQFVDKLVKSNSTEKNELINCMINCGVMNK